MAPINSPLNGASLSMRTIRRTDTVLVGASAVMQEVFRLVDRVGPTDSSVLISGESGSGKEVIAQLIHDRSPRAAGPFITINCSAIPSGLIEAELFGYEKGDSVGEGRSHAGAFQRAEGGTLFLDEITEMPSDMQARLLRVLEIRTYYRAGGVTETPANVRVIASANRNPHGTFQKGRLRDELLYRLAVFPIAVPALRDRGDDIVLLANRFLAELNARDRTNKRFSADTRSALKQHNWPGNVRELRNCIERAFIMADEVVELAPLIVDVAVLERGAVQANADRLEIRVGARIDEVERSLIEATLLHFRGNKRRAADALGCSLKTLYNKLHAYARSQQGVANTWSN
jgi:DNA-binding NtrC family response regulator